MWKIYLKKLGKPDRLEEKFGELLDQAGLEYTRYPRIEAPHPVKDKNGNIKKTVTTADYQVFDRTERPPNRTDMIIELTVGAGHGPHKAAQRRVIVASGLEDKYKVVDGYAVNTLEDGATRLDPKHLKKLMKRKMGW
jgi:hypothetical protein